MLISLCKNRQEDNLLVAFSWAWYNGSYTMAAKPIKSLELHYTMIQFLITSVIYFQLSYYTFIINTNNNNNNNNNIHLETAHITCFHDSLQFCKGEIGRQHVEGASGCRFSPYVISPHPSRPIHTKTRPQHRKPRPLLFTNSGWVL